LKEAPPQAGLVGKISFQVSKPLGHDCHARRFATLLNPPSKSFTDITKSTVDAQSYQLRSLTLSPIDERDTNCPCVGNVGGRTAWSSTVSINAQNFSARYWYDGQYINNAKEDAAEVALKLLNQQPRASTIYPGQIDSRQTTGYGRGAGGV
ncbi:hypothetical protein N7481_013137, partial [Penicillium waksmanii]|uniref:uncharacterized protein n=1 Tax=Penicillium waksmanii TaxID=69791 RepID=UPI0025485309